MKRDKEGHYIIIKGSIHEEDITIINIYVPNIGAPQNIRQMLTSMKGEIHCFRVKYRYQLGLTGLLYHLKFVFPY